MPDEASTHYAAVVDQLIEGHQWLKDELGVNVVNAWINDPFGYSSTMPYLWKKSGIENMIILRMHQAIKATLMRRRMMDYKWRPYWNTNDDGNDILVNVMPYPGYWNSDVCGPDQTICKQFNFLHLRSSTEAKPVTTQNVDDLAAKLYKAYKFTASLYKYKTLIVFLGEDNSYDDTHSFEDTNFNYGKLIKFINEKKEWNMNIRFGTIADYFKNVRNVERTSVPDAAVGGTFPLLSGDFFPYSDFENDTWTGYYTTRIWLKRFVREIEPVLRMADVYSVLAYHHCVREKHCLEFPKTLTQVLSDLQSARRDVGIFQHHDGITGTSLPSVVSDYEYRLKNAFDKTKTSLTTLVQSILTNGKVQSNSGSLENDMVKSSAQSILSQNVFNVKEGMKLVVANPLERSRFDAVSFFLDKSDIELIDDTGKSVLFQVSTSADTKLRGFKRVTIQVDLSPYEIKTLEVKMVTHPETRNKVEEKEYGPQTDKDVLLVIKNSQLKIEVNQKTGMLQTITDKEGRVTTLGAMFLKYKPSKSGAYLFGPEGPAKPLDELLSNDPRIRVINGTMFSEIEVQHETGFNQKFTLYHADSVKATGLFITNQITLALASTLSNTEVVLRFNTDINNDNIFFTDQNGFQLMGRKNEPERPIETNFYPITNMAVIEDKTKRLTIHSAQSHGVAALCNGCLEVMLDRNVYHDDRKGLGMGTNERILTLTEFVLDIQYKSTTDPSPEPRFTYPTTKSVLLNEQLQSKLQVFVVKSNSDSFDKKFTPFVPQFPCDLSVVGMRFLPKLGSTDVSLILHRKPVHCSFNLANTESCNLRDETFAASELMSMFGISGNEVTGSIKETSLTHIKDIATVSPDTDLGPGFSELRSFLIMLGSTQ